MVGGGNDIFASHFFSLPSSSLPPQAMVAPPPPRRCGGGAELEPPLSDLRHTVAIRRKPTALASASTASALPSKIWRGKGGTGAATTGRREYPHSLRRWAIPPCSSLHVAGMRHGATTGGLFLPPLPLPPAHLPPHAQLGMGTEH
jgi:hypothetical protein